MNNIVEIVENLDDDEVRYIHQSLNLLRENYERAAKPYIDRLVQIHERRLQPLRIVVTTAEAEAMGFTIPDPER